MAKYTTSIAVDTTGKGPALTTSEFEPDATTSLIRILANQGLADAFYGELKGSFTYDGSSLNGGTVDTYITYKGSPPGPDAVLESYAALNTPIDVITLLGLSGEAAAAYLFRMTDLITGSPFGDKLNAFDGNDQVDGDAGNDMVWGGKGKDLLFGGPGNDKIWGGPGKDQIFGEEGNDKMWGEGGKDTFFIFEDSGKERIKDYNRKKDALVIDTDLVKNQNKLEKLAKEKGDKVVIKFGGGDKLIIDDFSLKDLHKSTISFFDIDL
ncbi:calcium-binding protein [Bauldia litoralis]|uniref:calcium-binding protein n=1 Tax=Bauldia litoralis TaxID=665467 RepID=UPI0032649D28